LQAEFKYSNSCKLKLPAKPFALAFLINHIGRVTSTQRWLSWQRGRDARHHIRKASAKYATGTLPPKRVLSRSFTFFHNQHQSTTSHCCSRRQKGCMLQLFQARLSQASVFGIQSQLKGFGAHDDRSIPSTKANRVITMDIIFLQSNPNYLTPTQQTTKIRCFFSLEGIDQIFQFLLNVLSHQQELQNKAGNLRHMI
jgi:hypothetical protein